MISIVIHRLDSGDALVILTMEILPVAISRHFRVSRRHLKWLQLPIIIRIVWCILIQWASFLIILYLLQLLQQPACFIVVNLRILLVFHGAPIECSDHLLYESLDLALGDHLGVQIVLVLFKHV